MAEAVPDPELAGLLAEATRRAQEEEYYINGQFERDAAAGAPF